ncbi:DUF4190 domain-containing protein [Mycolicibacterium komossense]|uniref:DUF4190 domain-containing protein n=1 Tax=Mycolicibacterium komossense TaxID=1779 RepID=A0ABT3CC31_9MYCO|nr:DUF4190 domain-containing protein [Mycolicibacterium komossense]MCV7226938.1 DUF4190 domain-containing protein [Mycolicibacterium komossense]
MASSDRTGTINGTAIAALAFAVACAPIGIVLGHVARRQIRRTGQTGGGLAAAALIVGYLLTVVPVVLCISVTVTFALADAVHRRHDAAPAVSNSSLHTEFTAAAGYPNSSGSL